ncbi:MAG TPA: CPBP family intramembrane glutamic endopeptidase [Vicinamibacterales bacterium]|nr:CPBP family intramembrane glutamic endopeptidase [Vicinamibacterales bacterium]
MADIDESPAIIPPATELPPPPQPRPTWPTWVEILLCSGYPTQLLLGQLLVIGGIHPLDTRGSLSSTFVFALSMGDTALLLSLIIFLLRRRGERPLDVFFGGRPALPEIAAGVLSLPLVITVVVGLMLAIQRALPVLHNVPDNPLEALMGHGLTLWMFLAVVIVAGGVREELQRAFLLHRFRGDLGQPWMGLFITSLSFGLGHTLQGLDAAIITGTLGAIWGAMYLTRRSALASMVSHSLFNSGELLRIFLR